MKTGFIIIDEDRGSDMHGIDESQSFFNPTLSQASFNLWSDIDEGLPRGHFKPEFLTISFHPPLLQIRIEAGYPLQIERDLLIMPVPFRKRDVSKTLPITDFMNITHWHNDIGNNTPLPKLGSI
jgi:hypothetical protein